ncbi:hypothetical protein [Cohnella caldifontis]|uniref:hypothetical protein n=1 Tax=Cohnella caldifontis TaxID=3027471 RepID=UPI0023EC6739|nr:hypothetical protein [Cohnella sp. YIM B05605]
MVPQLPFSHRPSSSMLICSMASGAKHLEMLAITGLTFKLYAQFHQMDCLLLTNQRLDPSRPPAWDKVALLHEMSRKYKIVLWVDSDSIIRIPFPDIRDELYGHYPMYLARQDLNQVPNTGVWVVRGTDEARSMLKEIWNNTAYLYHPWWEQGALMDLMGFRFTGNPNPHEGLSFAANPWGERVGRLDTKWNSCDSKQTEYTVIKHYCGLLNQGDVLNWLHSDYHHFLSLAGNGP